MAHSRKTTARKATARKTSTRKVSLRKRATAKATEPRGAAASAAKRKAAPRRWSQNVTEHSDALDLRHGVFKLRDPRAIAASLKHSAEHSTRRKSNPYRSALSMLTFYINRAGAGLPKARRNRLERAKTELKQLFGRA